MISKPLALALTLASDNAHAAASHLPASVKIPAPPTAKPRYSRYYSHPPQVADKARRKRQYTTSTARVSLKNGFAIF